MVRSEVYTPYRMSRIVMYPREGIWSGLPWRALCTVAGEKKPSVPLKEEGTMPGTTIICQATGKRGNVITI